MPRSKRRSSSTPRPTNLATAEGYREDVNAAAGTTILTIQKAVRRVIALGRPVNNQDIF
jgi:hypothetical protein